MSFPNQSAQLTKYYFLITLRYQQPFLWSAFYCQSFCNDCKRKQPNLFLLQFVQSRIDPKKQLFPLGWVSNPSFSSLHLAHCLFHHEQFRYTGQCIHRIYTRKALQSIFLLHVDSYRKKSSKEAFHLYSFHHP